MIPVQLLNGLGLVAKGARKILPGTEYNQYFKPALHTDPMLSPGLTTVQTVETIGQMAKKYKGQTAALAQALKGRSMAQTLKNIWDFCYRYIDYELDQIGVEQLRTPNRIWADKKADCDCYSLFISTILLNLGIPHFYRVVKINHKPNYQHIYVIVPKEYIAKEFQISEGSGLGSRQTYYVIDPVVDSFNEEPRGITYKYDYPMIPVQLLNGLGTVVPTSLPPLRPQASLTHQEFGKEFSGLGSTVGGLGCPNNCSQGEHTFKLCREFSARVKMHLQNTIQELRQSRANGVEIDPFFEQALQNIVGNWETPETRLVTIIDAVKDPRSTVAAKTFFEALAFHAALDAKGLEGLAGFKDWWKTNIAKPVTRAYKRIEEAFAETWDNLKGFAKKVGEQLKKLGQLLLRWNPTITLLRVGTLSLAAMNFRNMSGDMRMYYENPTWEMAKAKGHNWGAWNKSKAKYEGIKNLANKLQATDHEFKSAFYDRKLKFGDANGYVDDNMRKLQEAFEADKAAIDRNVATGTPLFIGNLKQNYYGGSAEERMQPTSIVVVDTLGENGFVVLVSGIPSFEAVALKVHSDDGDPMSPGHAYAMDVNGKYWETIDGNWHPATYPGQTIEPFAKYRDRYYTVNADGQRDYDLVPESNWPAVHKLTFTSEKAKANYTGASIFQVSDEQAGAGAGSGTNIGPGLRVDSGSTTVVPGGGFNTDGFNIISAGGGTPGGYTSTTMKGLGEPASTLVLIGEAAATAAVLGILAIAERRLFGDEPAEDVVTDPNKDRQYNEETGTWVDPVTGEEFDANGNRIQPNANKGTKSGLMMPLLLGGGILAAVALTGGGSKKKGLGAVKSERKPRAKATPRTKTTQTKAKKAKPSKVASFNFN